MSTPSSAITPSCTNAFAILKSVIKAIIFDFFDVIRTDAYNTWLKAHNLAREGEYADAAVQQDLGNETVQRFFERLSELQGRPITSEEIDSGAKVHHDVLAIAEELRKHYKIALLSNAPSVFLRGLLTKHDLERYFDEIIISSEVQMVKPDPQIFTLMLSRLGVEPSETIFIDDNIGHVTAAQKLGIHSIQFVSAAQLQKDLRAAGVTQLAE